MCCDDPPPDFKLLGPPPKPPWLHYNLHCGHDGVVLQHEGQTSASPNNGATSFQTETFYLTRPNLGSSESTNTSVSISNPSVTKDPSSMFERHVSNTSLYGGSTTSYVENNFDTSSTTTAAALQQKSEEALFSNSTLNIVALVLFSLAAIFLIITLLVLWHRRRLLNKQQIEHNDIPDEYQFLYNYKVRGKFFKIPKITMLLRSKSSKKSNKNDSRQEMSEKCANKNGSEEASVNESSPINGRSGNMDMGYNAELQDLCMHPIQKPVYSKENSQSAKYKPEAYASSDYDGSMIPYQRPYSSLERGSSTTSGISSDGEWKYQEDHPLQYLEQGSPFRVRRLKRKGQRSRQTKDDGELGDAEGSVECLAKQEKRNAKEKHNQKPHKQQQLTPVLDPTKYFLHPKDDVIVHSKPPTPRSTSVQQNEKVAPKRPKRKTHQFTFNPPQLSEEGPQQQGNNESLPLNERTNSAAGPSTFPSSRGNSGEEGHASQCSNGGRKKKKKRVANKKDDEAEYPNTESYTIETMDNIDNELRESHA